MSALVRETADGWEVVDGKVVVSTHDSQIEALDAALAANGGRTRDAILRDPDTKDLNGAWRWIHATDVEDDPAYDDARIDETTVAQAVANLNAAPLPRPVNGMTSDSRGHGPAGQTLANGYVHHAVEVVAADGRHGACVIAELVPDVARNLDAGRIAWASIGLGGTTTEDCPEIRDAVFDHLALTNDPAVTTLVANNAIRQPGERFIAIRTQRITAPRARPKETPMAKTTIRKELAKLSLRGAALDALTKLCSALNISMDDEMSAEEWESPAVAAVRAVRTLAAAEKTLEAINASAAPAARSHARNVIAARAEVDDAKWGELVKALGLADGASVDDAIAAAGKMKAPEVEAEADKVKADAVEAGRAQKVATLEQRVADLTAKELARDNAAWLDEAIKTRGATVAPEARAKFEKALRTDGGRELVAGLIADLPVAPKTRQVASVGSRDVDVHSKTEGDAVATRAAELLPEIRKQFPNDDEQSLVARAQRAARA